MGAALYGRAVGGMVVGRRVADDDRRRRQWTRNRRGGRRRSLEKGGITAIGESIVVATVGRRRALDRILRQQMLAFGVGGGGRLLLLFGRIWNGERFWDPRAKAKKVGEKLEGRAERSEFYEDGF